MKKKLLYLGIAIIMIFLIGYFGFRNTGEENILNINLQEHRNLALHIHQEIEIEILGQKQTIPANIGVSNSGMRVIHTHDSTGKIHIESPYQYQFYLRDFFTVWNKNFNSNCIFEYCVDNKHELLFFVNNEINNEYENLPLNDEDMIKIIYKEK